MKKSVGGYVEKLGALCTADGYAKWSKYCEKQYANFSKNQKQNYHMIQQCIPKRIKGAESERYCTLIHSSTTHDSQKVEATKRPPKDERWHKLRPYKGKS